MPDNKQQTNDPILDVSGGSLQVKMGQAASTDDLTRAVYNSIHGVGFQNSFDLLSRLEPQTKRHVVDRVWDKMCCGGLVKDHECSHTCFVKLDALLAIKPPPLAFLLQVARGGCAQCLSSLLLKLQSWEHWDKFSIEANIVAISEQVTNSAFDRNGKMCFLARNGLLRSQPLTWMGVSRKEVECADNLYRQDIENRKTSIQSATLLNDKGCGLIAHYSPDSGTLAGHGSEFDACCAIC